MSFLIRIYKKKEKNIPYYSIFRDSLTMSNLPPKNYTKTKPNVNNKLFSDQEAPSEPREETYELLHGVVPAEEEEDH